MNTILIAVIVILSVLIIAATALFISLKFFKEKKKELRLKELEFYNEVYSDISVIEDQFDTFIQNIFAIFQIFDTNYFSKEFLGEDDQRTITAEVHKEVLKSISPTFLNRLLLVYSNEKLQEIINKKIWILVFDVAQSINTNTSSDEADNIQNILNTINNQ